jgi:hypothetical protein
MFGDIAPDIACLHLYYVIQAALSSWIMVEDSEEPIPQDCSIWFIILRSHTHSCDASNSAMISE